MPRPARPRPVCCRVPRDVKSHSTAPMARSNRLSPEISSAMICAVTVVPRFAPMMMAAAWVSNSSSAATNPTVSTDVTDDDCKTAVVTAPVSAPVTRFPARVPSRRSMRWPASTFKLSVRSDIPMRNRASPPRSPSPSSTQSGVSTLVIAGRPLSGGCHTPHPKLWGTLTLYSCAHAFDRLV